MADTVYDLCVIGAGIIGSAAARHASNRAGVKVCLIGPDEPRAKSMDREIFGAHYDEGRIARTCLHDAVWAKLAVNSIQRFRGIEQRSGVTFFVESGNIISGNDKTPYIKNVTKIATEQHLDHKQMSYEDIQNLFPYLKFPKDTRFLYQQTTTGHISPRKMVKAQKIVATNQGCLIIDEIVCGVNREVSHNGEYVMEVITESGITIMCHSVLLATGAFTNFKNLLPGLQVNFVLDPATVALVEIDQNMFEELRNMPCVRFEGQGHTDWYTDDVTAPNGVTAFYMLPPILYPNGRYYIKLGLFHGICSNLPFTNLEDIKRWFVHGNEDFAEKTKKLLLSLFNGLNIVSWHADYCAIVVTPTALPYIDKVHAQLGVAVGGNGLGAMSGDEIGRIAVDMMFGEWTSDIPKEHFKVNYTSQKANL